MSWIEFGNELEEDSKSNQKLCYKALKSMRSDKSVKDIQIKNSKGEIITKEIDIMKRWKEYFQTLLGQRNEEGSIETTERNQLNESEPLIEMQELDEVIKTLKNGKVPGEDKITSEMMKNLGETGRKSLLEIINKAWKKETILEEWGTALITPIHKKGDYKNCNNYRGITLLNTITKIIERIINNKLRNKIKSQLSEPQSGFRPEEAHKTTSSQ
ncbi:uncharacterized protein [Leptinotarsa decemlineata]|uniref:uncharacterized protein n=1 Tax=Leptinotarsa decemlineata TaxID=7539 RepID=UPI003D308B20